MSVNIKNAIANLLAQAGLGAIRASAWLNVSEEGEKRGESVTLTKSYFRDGAFHKSKCSFKVAELSAAIAVLKDIEAQLLVRSRSISMSNDAKPQESEEAVTDEF